MKDSLKTQFSFEYKVRHYGAVNWLGLWTLYVKEIKRFLNVGIQTVAAPAMTSWLFLLIMILALGKGVGIVNGLPFSDFLFPGLIIMSISQNSFSNTSSSITTGKMSGSIVDVLIPPISNREFIVAFIAAAVTRGLMVGTVTWLGAYPFLPLFPVHPFTTLFAALLASSMLGFIGLLAGIWAQKFDQLAIITNFIITPLTFLSGTFYSLSRLPEFLHPFVYSNPFFYMIDIFRYGFIGINDAPPVLSLSILIAINISLFFISRSILKSGYKIRT